MRVLKLAAVILAGALALTAIGGMMKNGNASDRPAPAKSPAQAHQGHLDAALYACEQWTRTHAKLGVDTVLDEYEISGKRAADRFRVGLDWRAKGAGLLMFSDCEYRQAGAKLVLVKARSGAK